MPSNKIERKSYLKEVVGTTRQAYEVILNRMLDIRMIFTSKLQFNFQIKLELNSLTAYHEQIFKTCRKSSLQCGTHFDNQIMNPQKKERPNGCFSTTVNSKTLIK